MKNDGTYEGIEIKSNSSLYTCGGSQWSFDERVRSGEAVVARLNGRLIQITSVFVRRVFG